MMPLYAQIRTSNKLAKISLTTLSLSGPSAATFALSGFDPGSTLEQTARSLNGRRPGGNLVLPSLVLPMFTASR